MLEIKNATYFYNAELNTQFFYELALAGKATKEDFLQLSENFVGAQKQILELTKNTEIKTS